MYQYVNIPNTLNTLDILENKCLEGFQEDQSQSGTSNLGLIIISLSQHLLTQRNNKPFRQTTLLTAKNSPPSSKGNASYRDSISRNGTGHFTLDTQLIHIVGASDHAVMEYRATQA